MKNLILFCLLILIYTKVASAQDVIFLKNGNEIKSLIVEIESELIKYRNYDQPTGPIRNLSISEIIEIVYKDGTKEKFNQHNQSEGKRMQESSVKEEHVELKTVEFSEIRRVSIQSAAGFPQNYIKQIKTSQNGRYVMFYSVNPSAKSFAFRIYDLEKDESYQMKNLVSLADFSASLNTSFAFSENSEQAITFLNSKELQIFDIESGNEVYRYTVRKGIEDLTFSLPGINYLPEKNSIETNESWVYSSNYEEVKKMYTETDLLNFLNTSNGDAKLQSEKKMTFLNFTNTYAVGHSGIFAKRIFICDLQTGRPVSTIDLDKTVLDFKISYDGSKVFAIQKDNLNAWNINNATLLSNNPKHENSVFDFDINKKDLLVTCSMDETICFWNGTNFKKLGTLNPRSRKGKEVATSRVFLTPDGSKLGCITFSNELIIYELKYNVN